MLQGRGEIRQALGCRSRVGCVQCSAKSPQILRCCYHCFISPKWFHMFSIIYPCFHGFHNLSIFYHIMSILFPSKLTLTSRERSSRQMMTMPPCSCENSICGVSWEKGTSVECLKYYMKYWDVRGWRWRHQAALSEGSVFARFRTWSRHYLMILVDAICSVCCLTYLDNLRIIELSTR